MWPCMSRGQLHKPHPATPDSFVNSVQMFFINLSTLQKFIYFEIFHGSRAIGFYTFFKTHASWMGSRAFAPWGFEHSQEGSSLGIVQTQLLLMLRARGSRKQAVLTLELELSSLRADRAAGQLAATLLPHHAVQFFEINGHRLFQSSGLRVWLGSAGMVY